MIRRAVIAFATFVLLAGPAAALQPPAGQAPAGQEGFVQIDELPQDQQLPAAPLLIAAYAFVWVALMVYLWSIWNRLGTVEAEMRALEQRKHRRDGP